MPPWYPTNQGAHHLPPGRTGAADLPGDRGAGDVGGPARAVVTAARMSWRSRPRAAGRNRARLRPGVGRQVTSIGGCQGRSGRGRGQRHVQRADLHARGPMVLAASPAWFPGGPEGR